MARYNSVILDDEPALFWDLDEASGTTVVDSSGNGNDGKRYAMQAVSAAGTTPGFWAPGVANDGGYSNFVAGNWSGPSTQDYPGTGFRADSYKPYVPGSKRSFECIVTKTEEASFATIFSGDGDTGSPATPHPTWEMGADGLMRFYANVRTFPFGWVDWGSDNTQHPMTIFELNVATHMVCTYDDSTGIAEWWINGKSMGKQGPIGYFGVRMAYDTVYDAGHFQVGWRGGAGFFPDPGNTETYGGFIDKIAVYERILTEPEIRAHYRAMSADYPPRGVARPDVTAAIARCRPALWMPLDSVYGRADLAGHSVTAYKGVDLGGGDSLIDGSEAGAAEFDGSDDFIDVAYTPFVNSADRAYCLLALVDSSGPATQTLIGSSGSTAQGFRVQVATASGDVTITNNGSTATWPAAWPAFDRPVFVLISHSGIGLISLTLDGKTALSNLGLIFGVLAATFHANVGNLQVGGYAGSLSGVTAPLKGRMQNLLVAERILTVPLTRAIYKATRQGVVG